MNGWQVRLSLSLPEAPVVSCGYDKLGMWLGISVEMNLEKGSSLGVTDN